MDYGRAGDSASGGGVVASISTGMIGQGVMNFGRFLGPIAAALLMALWVALLARQDLLSQDNVVRFLLYALGLILTFNMGRDITFLVVFPFVCGYAVLLWSEKKRGTTGGWTPESRGQRSEIGGRRSGDRGQRSEVRDQGAEVGASVFQGTGVSVSEGETVDGRRDVGAGGTVRTMPTQQPKRIARWMPRRVRAAIVAARNGGEGEGLRDHETKRPKDQETARGQSSEVGGEENGERLRDGRERPRQLAVPYRNYRRYRA